MVKMNKIFMVIVPELGCREVVCFSDVKEGFDEGMVILEVADLSTVFTFLNGETSPWWWGVRFMTSMSGRCYFIDIEAIS
jgi:hypothetical protein